MTRPSHFRPSDRTLWLTDLAKALAQAGEVLSQVDRESAETPEAHHLQLRIAALRSEVDKLRRGAFANRPTGGAGPRRAPSWRD